jgi:hypothetical protein
MAANTTYKQCCLLENRQSHAACLAIAAQRPGKQLSASRSLPERTRVVCVDIADFRDVPRKPLS